MSGRHHQVEEAFRIHGTPALRTLHKSAMAVTELRCDEANFGRTALIPHEDACLIALQLRACHDHDLIFEGQMVQPVNYFDGVTSIYVLRCNPMAHIRDPYQCIMFHLPRKVLDAITTETGVPRVKDLPHEAGVGVDDPVVRHLLASLLQALAEPKKAPSLFLDHVALALITHVAHSYGGMNRNAGLARGGLALWQQRRVEEIMVEALSEEIPLRQLADECGLSVRHFTRAFRQSTGVSPHQWLLKSRVERARMMLRNQTMPLSAIAFSCGFADQSHFTRVFTAMAGVSPGSWRRINAIRSR